MKRTKQQAEETRTEILRTAERLFLEVGYDSVTMEQIAQAAGVTRGAISWHFDNKAGLLTSLRSELQEPFDILAATLGAREERYPLVLLAETVKQLFIKLEAEPRQRGLKLISLRLDAALNTVPVNEPNIVDRLRVVFEAAQKVTPLRNPWTPHSAALSMGALLRGTIGEWALSKTEFSLVSHGHEMVCDLLRQWSGSKI